MTGRSIDFLKYFSYRKNLCLLEYIANILSLQYYKDENTITLSTEKLVVDINCTVKIYFVNENEKLNHIGSLLNKIYKEKNYLKFYLLLKEIIEEKEIDYAKYIEIISVKKIMQLLIH